MAHLLSLTLSIRGGLLRNDALCDIFRFHTDTILCQWSPASAEPDAVLDMNETMFIDTTGEVRRACQILLLRRPKSSQIKQENGRSQQSRLDTAKRLKLQWLLNFQPHAWFHSSTDFDNAHDSRLAMHNLPLLIPHDELFLQSRFELLNLGTRVS
jgi:hypothetical protein